MWRFCWRLRPRRSLPQLLRRPRPHRHRQKSAPTTRSSCSQWTCRAVWIRVLAARYRVSRRPKRPSSSSSTNSKTNTRTVALLLSRSAKTSTFTGTVCGFVLFIFVIMYVTYLYVALIKTWPFQFWHSFSSDRLLVVRLLPNRFLLLGYCQTPNRHSLTRILYYFLSLIHYGYSWR